MIILRVIISVEEQIVVVCSKTELWSTYSAIESFCNMSQDQSFCVIMVFNMCDEHLNPYFNVEIKTTVCILENRKILGSP